jgi:dihydrofolate synthase/folylpolyglutamate synthase
MRYADAIQFLYDLQWFGLKLGLENTFRLAALAGSPQKRLRFIHVAGTNGKGSTCAMLESIYRAAGLRVGLFTSPHLLSFGERIQVNRKPLEEAAVVRLVEAARGWLRGFPTDHSPTFFEVVTVMALRHFADEPCQLVIWETGMGGRLDATNIVTPLASVITNVQFDHEQWLGSTLAQITAEKAGIIKPGVPVVTAADAPEALAVLRETAASLGAPLTEVSAGAAAAPPLDKLALPLLGDHQRLNAALALAAVRAVADVIPVPPEAVEQGLGSVRWPGRLQVIPGPEGQINLLDGAHNPAGVAVLRAAIEKHFPDKHPSLIIGVLKDKDWAAMCRRLSPLAARIYLVPVASVRTASPEDLRTVCQSACPGARVEVCGSLEAALQRTEQEPFRVITGSLYLVGHALECLEAATRPPSNERGLNEWRASP